MRGGARLALCALWALALGSLLSLAVSSAASASVLGWSQPQLIDTTLGAPLSSVSCPSASLCVAVDEAGAVVTSTDPAAAEPTWTPASIGAGEDFDSVSCPSSELCVAAGYGGEIFSSTDPTGGQGAWHETPTESVFLSSVSCASKELCVMIGDFGEDLLISTDPTSATPTWKDSGAPEDVYGVSCPSKTLCVAVGEKYEEAKPKESKEFDDVFSTVDPMAATPTWTLSAKGIEESERELEGISCASETLCVVATDGGNALVSTEPTTAIWEKDVLAAHSPGEYRFLEGPACVPGRKVCAIRGEAGDVYVSSKPEGGASKWIKTAIDNPESYLDGISCVSSEQCTAVDYSGRAITSTDAASATPHWTTTRADADTTIGAVSCVSSSLCVAGDDDGNVLSSTDPMSVPASWASVEADPESATSSLGWQIYGISCASTTLCVAIDQNGQVVTSTDPTGSTGAWVVTKGIGSGDDIDAVSCASASLCVATNDHGEALVSTDPTGGAGAWSVAEVDPAGTYGIRSVSCPSSGFCAAVDGDGNVLTSTDPTGGKGAWSATAVDHGNTLTGISCASSTLCVAVDDSGNTITSTNPTGGTGAWTVTNVDAANDLSSVSCPSSTLCAAVDYDGNALTSTNPAGGAAWSSTPLGGTTRLPLSAVSCSASGLCAAVGLDGEEVTGAVSAPVVTTGTASAVSGTGATLAGTLDPNDAQVSACAFEYGTTTAYGSSEPCAQTPPLSSSASPVGATLTGLTPGTTYHFRLSSTNGGGTSSGADATFTTTAAPVSTPVLSHLKLSPSRFLAAGRGARIATPPGRAARHHKPKPGTTISYTDTLAALTTFTVLAPEPGILRGHGCLKPPRRHKGRLKGRRCTRYVAVGSFSHRDKAGANSLPFDGRLHGHRLAAGTFLLEAVPELGGHSGRALSVSFAILP
jgi:hypothetical protein